MAIFYIQHLHYNFLLINTFHSTAAFCVPFLLLYLCDCTNDPATLSLLTAPGFTREYLCTAAVLLVFLDTSRIVPLVSLDSCLSS